MKTEKSKNAQKADFETSRLFGVASPIFYNITF